MARPRIFVSSTYYDLKHLRSSVENFIERLGYEAILSEKGNIAYSHDVALDESCYREVKNADIFVLIVGGRYGAEKSDSRTALPRTFFERYDSITREEYKTAVERDIPIYILIERPVYSEFETFLRNKGNKKIKYAHVDSVNIFLLVEEIIAQSRNNPLQQFDKYTEIESWLREQWAGLFREMLTQSSNQTQIASLAAQVEALAEVNKTLRTYLEQVVSKIVPKDAAKLLIRRESKRLEEASLKAMIVANPLGRYLVEGPADISAPALKELLAKAITGEDFVRTLLSSSAGRKGEAALRGVVERSRAMLLNDANDLRLALGLTPWADLPARTIPRRAPRHTRAATVEEVSATEGQNDSSPAPRTQAASKSEGTASNGKSATK